MIGDLHQYFGGLQGIILRRLADGGATGSELIEAAYGSRSDGGPDHPDKCIVNTISKMRPELALHGYAIAADQGRSGYRLIELPEHDSPFAAVRVARAEMAAILDRMADLEARVDAMSGAAK